MADIQVRIDATTAQFDRQMAAAQKVTLAYQRTLAGAERAQLEYDAAVAKFGKTSQEAVLAEQRLGAALARTTEARIRGDIAAKKAAETQAASAAKIAAAQDKATLASTRSVESQARASAAKAAALSREVAAYEAAAAKETVAIERATAAQAQAQAVATRKIGTVAGGVGIAAAAALGLAAKAASDFNAKMAQVQSLSKASASEVAALSKATEGYADIGISASEAADAEIELIKAGVGVNDILGGALTGTLNAAAAGQIDVAQATEIASAAMVQFGLAGKDIPHAADLLAAGADKSLGGISDLGEGLKAVGTTAHQFGLNIDETVGALSQFAAAGLTGSLGGTALKQALLKLEAPSAKAAGLMEQYGISLYDAQGNSVDLANIAGQLQGAFKGVSAETRNAALATLFGSRAVQVANVLYKDGAKVTQQWVDKVNDAGFAADQASGKMDSLQGDLQKLGAEVQNAAINFGQQLQPALRAVTEDATSFVGFLDSIPGPLKEAAALTLAFTAAVGLSVFAYSRASTALKGLGTQVGITNIKMAAMRGGVGLAGATLLAFSSNIKESNETLGILAQTAGAAALGFSVGGPWGAAIGGGVGLLTSVVGASDDAGLSLGRLTASLDENTGAWTRQTKQVADNISGGLAQILTSVGLTTNQYTSALHGNADAMGAVYLEAKKLGAASFLLTDPIDEAKASADAAADALFHLVTGGIHKVTPAAAAAAREVRTMGGTMLDTAGDIFKHATALGSAKTAAEQAAAAEHKLEVAANQAFAALLKLDNLRLGKEGDADNFAASIDAANAALKENGRTLDQNTEKGRANREILRGIASAALTLAADFKTGSKSQVSALEKGRTALYEQEIAFGKTKTEARDYVNTVLGIPDSMKTKADIDSQVALAQIKTLQAQYDLTPHEVKTIVEATGAATTISQLQSIISYENYLQGRHVQTYVDTILRTIGSAPGGHSVYGQASGGLVRGPGTGTSDSVLRALSNGEFVQKTAAVNREGVAKMQALNEGRATIVPLQGFAKGGQSWTGSRSASISRGSSTITTDPAVVSELRGIRADLNTLSVRVNNPGEIATGVRSVADDSVAQNAAHRQTLADMYA